MGHTRVTDKYQITLPADVRARVPVVPGETLRVEARDAETIVVIRRRRFRRPLDVLVARKPLVRHHVPPDELDRLMEP